MTRKRALFFLPVCLVLSFMSLFYQKGIDLVVTLEGDVRGLWGNTKGPYVEHQPIPPIQINDTFAEKRIDGRGKIGNGRYIIYNGDFGSINAQIMSLQTAICLAKMSDRVVLFPGFSSYSSNGNNLPFKSLMDAAQAARARLPLMDMSDVENLSDLKVQAKDVKDYFDLPNVIEDFESTFKGISGSLDSSVRLVKLPVLYYWKLSNKDRCSPEMEKYFYLSVIPKPEIRKVVDDFVLTVLPPPYASIYYSVTKKHCRKYVNSLIEFIRKDTHDKRVLSFYLSSKEDKVGSELIRLAFNTGSLTFSWLSDEMKTFVDMLVMAKSNYIYADSPSAAIEGAAGYNTYMYRMSSPVTVPELSVQRC